MFNFTYHALNMPWRTCDVVLQLDFQVPCRIFWHWYRPCAL